MILELLEYCLTPASGLARRLGFLRSSIAVRSRFSRCSKAWEPHLRQTREAIKKCIPLAKKHRTVAVLGAGLLHDIPLRELSESFEEVLLVDIVHTWNARWITRRFSNIQRITADLTACAELLPEARNPQNPLPTPVPSLLLENTSVDLVLSVNVLSQLGWIPGRILEGHRSESEILALQAHLVRAHLEYLLRFPGHSVLVTDHTWSRFNAGKSRTDALSRWSVIRDVPLPEPDLCWDWEIAPAPEKESLVDWVAHTVFYADWKRAAQGRVWEPG